MHLDYCAWVLSGQDLRTACLLQVAQNACIRFIFSLDRRAGVHPRRARLGLLPVRDRRMVIALARLHRLHHEGRPAALLSTIDLQQPFLRRRRSERRALRFVPPRCGPTGGFDRSFAFTTIKMWNALPAHITAIESLSIFKRAVVAYLLRQEQSARWPRHWFTSGSTRLARSVAIKLFMKLCAILYFNELRRYYYYYYLLKVSKNPVTGARRLQNMQIKKNNIVKY